MKRYKRFEEVFNFKNGVRYKVKVNLSDGDSFNFIGAYNKAKNVLIDKKGTKLEVGDDLTDIEEIPVKKRETPTVKFEPEMVKWIKSVDAYNKKHKER